MDLNEVLRVLRERWRIILGCLLLGLLGAAVATQLMPRQYEAAVTMYVSSPIPDPTAPGASVSQDAAYQGSLLAKARMQSYALLLTNDRVTRPVVEALGLPDTPAQLAGRITVSAVPDTVVLTTAVTADQPTRAADIANRLAQEFVTLVDQLERPPGAPPSDPAKPLPGQIAVQVVQPAVAAPDPVQPRPALNLALGALVGLLLGVAGAFLRNAVDASVKSRERLRNVTGVPVLAAIPGRPSSHTHPIRPGSRTPRAEAVRLLRTNLQFGDLAHDTRLVAVTAPASGDGTTTTVCDLAVAAADAGSKVLVIDADLRTPSVTRLFGVEDSPGLAALLSGDAPIGVVLRTWREGDLAVDVLPAGPGARRPSELLAGPRLPDLLSEVREDYDLVLIDTAPLLSVADTAAIAPLADGVLLVVGFGRTTWTQVSAAVEAVAAVSGRLLGTVMTRAPGRPGPQRVRAVLASRRGLPAAPAPAPASVLNPAPPPTRPPAPSRPPATAVRQAPSPAAPAPRHEFTAETRPSPTPRSRPAPDFRAAGR